MGQLLCGAGGSGTDPNPIAPDAGQDADMNLKDPELLDTVSELPLGSSVVQPGRIIKDEELGSDIAGDIEKGDRVYSGNFSDVYKGVWRKPSADGGTSELQVALKYLREPTIGKPRNTNEQKNDRINKVRKQRFVRIAADTAQRMKREMVVWSGAKHPNILPFYGFRSGSGPENPCLITPWCGNGTLMHYVAVQKGGTGMKISLVRCTFALKVGLGLNGVPSSWFRQPKACAFFMNVNRPSLTETSSPRTYWFKTMAKLLSSTSVYRGLKCSQPARRRLEWDKGRRGTSPRSSRGITRLLPRGMFTRSVALF